MRRPKEAIIADIRFLYKIASSSSASNAREDMKSFENAVGELASSSIGDKTLYRVGKNYYLTMDGVYEVIKERGEYIVREVRNPKNHTDPLKTLDDVRLALSEF